MDRLNSFVGKFVNDLGAAVHAGMVVIGEKTGLYKAFSQYAYDSSGIMAKQTATDERYVSEWLASQAAGGYIDYDRKTEKYSLNPEQAFTMANEQSPRVFARSV